MSAEKTKDPRTVTLKGLRASFMEGLKDKKKPPQNDDATPRHNWNFINEKGGKHFAENQKKIYAAMAAAGEKAWKKPDAYETIAEDNPKRVCFKEGRRFKNAEGKVYAGYEDNYAFSVSGPNGGQRRPILKDRHKRDVEEKDILDVFYGGTYCDAIVSFFGTDKGGSRGIFATCELIRSHQEGEHMGGGYQYDEDDLDELDDLDDDGLEEMADSGSGDDLDGLLD